MVSDDGRLIFSSPSHFTAAIRVALRAHGFTVDRRDIDRSVKDRNRVGRWLRDCALPECFPLFYTESDYHTVAEIDPFLWERLPQMAGFGYQQAVLFHGIEAPWSEVDASVAILGGAFGAGIALFDYLVDEHASATLVYSVINPEIVRGMFDPSLEVEAALAEAHRTVADSRLNLLCALVATCAAGFRKLYSQSGNEVAWKRLAGTVGEMYEAQRVLSHVEVASPAELRELLPAMEAKSVLPFVAAHHLAALGVSRTSAQPRPALEGLTLGRAISLVDDLVDAPKDYIRGSPNTVIVQLADMLAHRGRSWAKDTDLYDAVDAGAKRLLELLRPSAFGLKAGGFVDSRSNEPEAWRGKNKGAIALFDFARATVAYWARWQDETHEVSLRRDVEQEAQQAVNGVIAAASQMLLAQQRDGYREAVHYLRLPRLDREKPRLETHSALLFQRTIVLDALLDAYAAGFSVPRSVLDAEALAILRAKHPEARGGWNYVPEVPELPPDADDLGMVLQVLCRVGGPALASVCDEAIGLVLAAAEEGGGLPTWILDLDSHSALDKSMRTYVELTASGGVHPDVVSNLIYGMVMYEPKRYHDHLLRAAAYLEAVQDARGTWSSRWYTDPYYGTYRAVSALSHITPDSQALKRGQNFILRSQRAEGSWGESWSDPLATALAILALSVSRTGTTNTAVKWGVLSLVAAQEVDGGWPASSFIAFPRSDGVGMHTYASRTITTAFCLKALLAA